MTESDTMATTSTFTFAKDLMLTFLDVEPEAITPDKTFTDLGVDSLDLIELQLEVERHFGVSLSSDGLAKSKLRDKTLGEFVTWIDSLRAGSVTAES
jgi:acyl carrier protein